MFNIDKNAELKIKIGNCERTYVFVETNAPAYLDFTETIKIVDSVATGNRFILIPEYNVEYQFKRYSDGQYDHSQCSITLFNVQKIIFEKLCQ